jgi:hypothetical protein
MRSLWTKTRAASIPAEVVQLIITAREICLPHKTPVLGGARIEVDDSHSIALSILADVEQSNVCEPFCWGVHCHAR